MSRESWTTPGVIRSPLGFVLLTVARGNMRNLKAGEYQIPQGANTVAVLAMLAGGQVLQHSVVFREGTTVAELARPARRRGPGRARRHPARRPRRTLPPDARHPGESLEGYLFPDTYQFVKGMMPEEILARMVARMREQISPEILAAARARNIEHAPTAHARLDHREGGGGAKRDAAHLRGVLEPASSWTCRCRPTPPFSTRWEGAAAPDARRPARGLPVQHVRRVGPASRPHRAAPALRRSRPRRIRPLSTICTSWRWTSGVIASPPPSPTTTRPSRSIVSPATADEVHNPPRLTGRGPWQRREAML